MREIKFEFFVKYFLPVVLWMTVIFIFSSYPTAATSEVFWKEFLIKKSAHIIEYGVLATLVFRALKKTQKYSLWKIQIFSILIPTFYGITDEFHQSFTPGREPTLRDISFDILGAFLAVFLISIIFPKLKIRGVKQILRLFEL